MKSFPLAYTARVYILFQCELINQAACDLAREVANEGDALVAGNFSQTPSYMSGLGKEVVQEEFKKQVDVFVKNDVDFLLGEVIVFSWDISRARNFQSNYWHFFTAMSMLFLALAVYVCGGGGMGDWSNESHRPASCHVP